MKEEDRLNERIGRKEPFQVPENYFADLTQQVMDRLPQKECIEPAPAPTTWQKIKPWLYLAAMFMGIMAGGKLFVGEKPETSQPEIQLTLSDIEQITDESWQMIIEDAMLDETTFVQYFANNE